VDVHDKLDEIVRLVEDARAMPMSSSALINRSEVLDLLGELGAMLPVQLDQADLLLADREAVVEQGRLEAARIIEQAQEEHDRLVEETEVVQAARERAARIERDAQAESERLLAEADDYVDRKLGEFEIALDKLTAQVRRGREHLAARRLGERRDDEPLDGPSDNEADTRSA
jgi:cell division septum initiation protein DivIVA